MKLFIPACGDRIKLTTDWSFPVVLEHRNLKFAGHRGLLKPGEDTIRWGVVFEGQHWSTPIAKRPFTLLAGTVLEIDRVYIRQYAKGAATPEDNFDSITFRVTGEKHGRFWVKLVDANNIECELDSTYAERAKSDA